MHDHGAARPVRSRGTRTRRRWHNAGHEHARRHGHDDDEHRPSTRRPRIAFVGAGHVGTALAVAFARAGWPVTAVASRDEARRRQFPSLVPGARAFAEPNAVLDDGDVIFLTVPDDAVARHRGEPVAVQRPGPRPHQRGACPRACSQPAMAAGTSLGSFHPLVAFADLERALAAPARRDGGPRGRPDAAAAARRARRIDRRSAGCSAGGHARAPITPRRRWRPAASSPCSTSLRA